MEALWDCPGVRDFFSQREVSASLEEMILLSSTKSPLTDFPADVNQNTYSEIIDFGLGHSRGIIFFLLNLLVRKEKLVQERDVVKIAFFFSSLAHAVSRNNDALAKTKSLLLQSQGLTVEGLDMLSHLGICETGRSTLNQSDLLAEVADGMLRHNLDLMDQHMTIKFIQNEKNDTSHLNCESMSSCLIPNLFNMKQILIEDQKNNTEFKHIKKVLSNTLGRLLGEHVKQVRELF